MGAWEWPDTKILRVIDGDTIDAMLTRDLGFGGKAAFPVRLRLNRINAPSSKSAKGKLAYQRVIDVIAEQLVMVTTIKSYKFGGPEGDLGEYMAEVVLPGGANVSDLLVTEKLAVYWDGKGSRPDDQG